MEKNAIRIISVLNAYYEDNAYYVRIKGVLVFNKVCPYVCKQFLLGQYRTEKRAKKKSHNPPSVIK